ncbi:MAG: hypothetical protein QGG94_03910 [Prochlorococcaceae cyanobacterium ETNP1_MAG_9]|nr:hypothetical protein [Prochlorococcaceae cyanobacterium ETNP1_MAG_9]
MSKNFWSKGLKLNIHAPGTGVALMILALTQLPVAVKTAAEVACIGEISHKQWKQTKSHKGVNIFAVRQCNGSN